MQLTETKLKKIIIEEFVKYSESLSPEEHQRLIDEGWKDIGRAAALAGTLATGALSPGEAEASPVGGGQGIEQTVAADDRAQLAYINQQINRARHQTRGNMQDASSVKRALASAAQAKKNSLKAVDAEMANLTDPQKNIWEAAKRIGGEAYSKQAAAGKNMAKAEAAWRNLGDSR